LEKTLVTSSGCQIRPSCLAGISVMEKTVFAESSDVVIRQMTNFTKLIVFLEGHSVFSCHSWTSSANTLRESVELLPSKSTNFRGYIY
jgi:hypothetical protein